MKLQKTKKMLALVAVFAVLLLSCGIALAGAVPDTGDTSERNCNPHSYYARGSLLVNDNATGLIWQKATAPGTYTWQQAIDYCNNLKLGGYDDWRLPAIQELSYLVDSSIAYPGPTINTDFFSDTEAFNYWSATAYAGDSDIAWTVDFNYGSVVDGRVKTSKCYVRAVRGKLSTNKLIDNKDGTITDNRTGLMWQKLTPLSKYTWDNAKTYCENLTLGSKSDWRLPTRNELQSIVDYSKYNLATDTKFFPDMAAANYWSSTSFAYDPAGAWFVHFKNGSIGYVVKTGYASVRAVRGGQCGSSTLCPAQKVLGEANQNIESLRFFRDSTLAKNALGRKAIEIYYNNADSINAALDRSPALRATARKFFEAVASLMESRN